MPTNYALSSNGGTVAATDNYPSTPSSYLNDANESVDWFSNTASGISAGNPFYVYFTLSTARSINKCEWLGSAGWKITDYVWQYKNPSNVWTDLHTPVAGNSSTDFQNTFTAVDGAEFRLKVTGVNNGYVAGKEGKIWGDPITDTTPPSDVTNLTATKINNGQVNIDSDAATDNIVVMGYTTQRRMDGGAWGTLTPSAKTFSDTENFPTAPGTYSFEYRRKAFDAAGNLSANWSNITPPISIEIPTAAGPPASANFDEVLLSKYYSNFAEGGPEWATDIIRSGLGGAVSVRNINREDYVSKYEISYAELLKEKLADLRKFAILRRGMGRGFRFLAPDDQALARERVGILNSGTGEIERLTSTNGSTTVFYICKYYRDDFSNYLRRIIKPSALDALTVEIAASSAPQTITDSFTLSATSGEIIPDKKTGTLSTISKTVEVDFYRGKLTFNSAPSANLIIYVTGVYHLPVFFSTDWHKMRIDESAISDFTIGVEEVLPVELGLI